MMELSCLTHLCQIPPSGGFLPLCQGEWGSFWSPGSSGRSHCRRPPSQTRDLRDAKFVHGNVKLRWKKWKSEVYSVRCFKSKSTSWITLIISFWILLSCPGPLDDTLTLVEARRASHAPAPLAAPPLHLPLNNLSPLISHSSLKPPLKDRLIWYKQMYCVFFLSLQHRSHVATYKCGCGLSVYHWEAVKDRS